jgi:thiol-disulfide isomerase/thioredoxin
MHLSCMPSLASTAAALRRRATPLNVVMLALWVFVAIRFFPHAKALVGIPEKYSEPPEYFVSTLDGRPITADSLRGKVVLVNFWATWCGPCRVEMPMLEAMWKRHRDDGFVLLGLSVDRGSSDLVRFFLSERDITYPIAIVGSETERAFGGVTGYPTSILLDRSGRIRHRVLGAIAPATLEPAVRRLLDEPVPAVVPAVVPALVPAALPAVGPAMLPATLPAAEPAPVPAVGAP